MKSKVRLIATTAFGLESIVKREVERLGFSDIQCSDGKVEYTADFLGIPRSNIWLRSADRVLVKIGEFTAKTFDELFEQTFALDWDWWIPIDGKFTVTGKSVRSTLYSVPDVQSIVKKAVVERMKKKYNTLWFQETGAEYTIQAAILKDCVTLTIDTTGPGLHKRGYRARATKAPLKETLAAALINLSRYNGKKPFLDPCCGSGTLAIEAAIMAKNIAPGLVRSFVSESWHQVPPALWKEVKMAAYGSIRTDIEPEIFGYDIDSKAIEIARANAELAGVDDCIVFDVCDAHQLVLPRRAGTAVINPPYGERLGQIREVEALYSSFGSMFNKTDWQVYVLTPDEFFEKAFGQRARAKRKLFNGMIKTDLYQFF